MEQLWSSWSRLSKLRGNRTQRGKAVRCKDELSSAVWRLSYSERNNLLQTFLHNSYMNKLRSRAPLRLYCSFCVSNEFSAHYSGGQRWKRKDSFSYICRAVNKQVMSVFVCLHESCRSRRLSLSVWIIKLRSGLHQEEQNASRLWGSKPGIFRSLEDKVQLDMSRTLKKYTNRIRCSASPAGRLHDDVSSSQPGSSAAPTDDSARSQISSPVYICKLNMFQMLDYQPSYRGTCPEAPRLRSSGAPGALKGSCWLIGLCWCDWSLREYEPLQQHICSHDQELVLPADLESPLQSQKSIILPVLCFTGGEESVRNKKASEELDAAASFNPAERHLQRAAQGAEQRASTCEQTFTTCVCSGLRHRSSLVKLRKILILIYIHIIPRAFTDPEFSST